MVAGNGSTGGSLTLQAGAAQLDAGGTVKLAGGRGVSGGDIAIAAGTAGASGSGGLTAEHDGVPEEPHHRPLGPSGGKAPAEPAEG